MSAQGPDQIAGRGWKGRPLLRFKQKHRLWCSFRLTGQLPGIVTMAGQMQRLHRLIFGKPFPKFVRIVALLDQKIKLGRSCRRVEVNPKRVCGLPDGLEFLVLSLRYEALKRDRARHLGKLA